MKKCEWSCDGVCEYYASYEEQQNNEVEWSCDGTEEEQKECGMMKND